MMQYVKMPQPLLVIGLFYALVAAFYLFSFIKDGYWRGMWSNVWSTLLYYPKRNAAALVIVLLLVLFVDLPVAKLAKYYFNEDFYRCIDFVNAMGEGWFIGGVVFSLFMIYQFLGKYQLVAVAKMSFMASIFAGLFNAILKVLINRERPGIGMNPDHFFHFFATGCKHIGDLIYASNSMPSGHTITIFAAITPFFLFARTVKIRLLLVFFAAMICFARIYTLNHWVSDVFVSSVLGCIIGRAAYSCNKYRIEESGK